MRSHLCNVVKNYYTRVYSVNYGDPQVSWPQQDLRQHKKKVTTKPTDITAEKTQPRQSVVDSRQNSQTHGNIKQTMRKQTHASRNSTHGEKDIFKNRNEESLKQGILGTWNL